MPVRLTEPEHRVLAKYIELEGKDPDGAWAFYYADIIEAAGGDFDNAQLICASLRRRKLLKGEGRGVHASYYPTDKGREAVA